MKKSLPEFAACVLFFGALLASLPARAHEFWFPPVLAPLAVGDTARLELRVGEYFEGESLGFAAAQTLGLRQFTATGSKDLRGLLPPPSRGASPTFDLPLTAPGTYLVAFDSQPSQIELPAGTFHAYLHDEGLDFIKAQRTAAGDAEKPGRERYRRHIKTLLKAGGLAKGGGIDNTFAKRTGQRLEIVPLNDPFLMRRGDALGLQVFFDDQPLAGALLKAWHRQTGQTLIIRAITAPDGKARFNLPYDGGWMISVVHMVPVAGAPGIDWDSLWGNLSFSLPAAKSAR